MNLRQHDIERVEVLLGTRGALCGAGTLAGAVRYLPRRPDATARSFAFRGDLFALEHGVSDGSNAGLTFNLRLVTGKLALSGSANPFLDPGFIDSGTREARSA